MDKKNLIFAALLLFATGGHAQGACTAEEAQAKQQTFLNAALPFAQSNPEKYQEVAVAMEKELPVLRQIDDYDKLCDFYDEWTKRMQ
jgi:hypothetical protein